MKHYQITCMEINGVLHIVEGSRGFSNSEKVGMLERIKFRVMASSNQDTAYPDTAVYAQGEKEKE